MLTLDTSMHFYLTLILQETDLEIFDSSVWIPAIKSNLDAHQWIPAQKQTWPLTLRCWRALSLPAASISFEAGSNTPKLQQQICTTRAKLCAAAHHGISCHSAWQSPPHLWVHNNKMRQSIISKSHGREISNGILPFLQSTLSQCSSKISSPY